MSLNQNEREQLEQDLLAQARDINAKLAALGIKDSTPKQKVAPDGGPVSQAHSQIKTRLRKLIPVVMTLPDGSTADALVAEEHLNPQMHKRIDGQEVGVRVRRRREIDEDEDEQENEDEPEKINRKRLGSQTKDELLTLTMPVLSGLYEVSLLREVPTDKAKLVEAILDVRGK